MWPRWGDVDVHAVPALDRPPHQTPRRHAGRAQSADRPGAAEPSELGAELRAEPPRALAGAPSLGSRVRAPQALRDLDGVYHQVDYQVARCG